MIEIPSLEYLSEKVKELHNEFVSAKPFPYIIIDNFLPDATAEKLIEEFPANSNSDDWIHYNHYNENKHGLNKLLLIPENIRSTIAFLNSEQFVSFLKELTGIENLVADPTLEGGGIHIAKRGGYLNIHADFAVHPRVKTMERKINVLFYLNENWKEEYNGSLEFWDKDMNRCERKIAPVFNRLVVFNTTKDSLHGFPEPLNCPESEIRKSIALYYYTQSETAESVIATKYRTLPNQGITAKFSNWIDNKMIFTYTVLKRTFNISDTTFSKFLKRKQ